ncbi:hypothetical protein D3C76_1707490 [compost metagenome]
MNAIRFSKEIIDAAHNLTISTGDKVRHKSNKVRHTGHVRAVSVCGKAALVRWTYSNTDVLNTEEKVSDLEVSHD